MVAPFLFLHWDNLQVSLSQACTMDISHELHSSLQSTIPFRSYVWLMPEWHGSYCVPFFDAIDYIPSASQIAAHCLQFWEEEKLSAHSWMKKIVRDRSSCWWLHIFRIRVHLHHGLHDSLPCSALSLKTIISQSWNNICFHRNRLETS